MQVAYRPTPTRRRPFLAAVRNDGRPSPIAFAVRPGCGDRVVPVTWIVALRRPMPWYRLQSGETIPGGTTLGGSIGLSLLRQPYRSIFTSERDGSTWGQAQPDQA